MQQEDRRTLGGAGFRISDIEEAGIDPLQGGERGVRPRRDRGQRRFRRAGLRRRGADAELGGGEAEGGGAEEAAAAAVDRFGRLDLIHWDTPWDLACSDALEPYRF